MGKKRVIVSEAVKLAGFEAGPEFGRALKAVRAALQRQAIAGEKGKGGQWLVDPAVVATYLAARQQKSEGGQRFMYQQKVNVSGQTVGIAFVDRPQWDRLVAVAQAGGFGSVSAMATALDGSRAGLVGDDDQTYTAGNNRRPVFRLQALAQVMGFAGISPLLRALADGQVTLG